MNLRIPVVATFSVLFLSGCFLSTPLHEKTVNLTVPHVPDQALRVESSNGRIEVTRETRADVQITAVVRARTPERLEATTVSAERDAYGELSVRALWPDDKRRSNEGCHYAVLAPSVSALHLETSNGSVKADGFSGKARLKTSNGSVTLENHEGPVSASTSNGSVSVSGRLQSAELKTSNGKITASGLSGEIDARTSNGSIKLGLAREFEGLLDLSTSNGSVKVDSDLESAVVSRTKKRAAKLRIGGKRIQSKARTSNGSIRVERE